MNNKKNLLKKEKIEYFFKLLNILINNNDF